MPAAHAPPNPVQRLFRACRGGIDLHVRTAGPQCAAPVLLALHESPRSSASLLPIVQRLSGALRVIAVDTPGFGLSGKLSAPDAGIAAYADAFVSMMDGIGVETFALYGTHTGAVIACDLASRYPRRVSHLLLDGMPLFAPEEKECFANGYFAPYRPDRSGRHVAELWSRTLDQAHWFPWHARGETTRLPRRPLDLAHLDATVAGQLQAGEHYSVAYKLAVDYDGYAALSGLDCAVSVFARESDLLHPHLSRVPKRINRVSLTDSVDEVCRFIRDRTLISKPCSSPPFDGNSPTRHFVRIADYHVHAARKSPLPTQSPARFTELPYAAVDLIDDSDGEWIIDLPGTGYSEAPPGTGWRKTEIEEVRLAIANDLKVDPPPLPTLTPLVQTLVSQEPLPVSALDGRRLLACWFAARNALIEANSKKDPTALEIELLFCRLYLAPCLGASLTEVIHLLEHEVKYAL